MSSGELAFLLSQANVMLEYTLEDAEALLTKNMSVALKNLGIIQHDLEFVK